MKSYNYFLQLARRKRLGVFNASAAHRKHVARQKDKQDDKEKQDNDIQMLLGMPKYLIQLGSHRMKPIQFKRAKNWKVRPIPTTGASFDTAESLGRYSSRCRYIRYEYQTNIESWGVITGNCLYWRIDTDDGPKKRLLRPWRGWHWELRDGICLVDGCGKREYHPTATDLLTNDMRGLAALARDCERLRKEARWERERMRRFLQNTERNGYGVTICLRDAMRAGHCRAGITDWAHMHRLDIGRHYRPTELPIDRRVGIVLAMAMKRHRQELRQGFCNLANHRV